MVKLTVVYEVDASSNRPKLILVLPPVLFLQQIGKTVLELNLLL